MKALITGVEGFVGRYLAAHLSAESYEVWGTTRHTRPADDWPAGLAVQTLRCDVASKADVENALAVANPDEIYHLAGVSHVPYSWDNPEITLRANLLGTLHLFDTVRAQSSRKPKILLVSSADVYGQQSAREFDEDDATFPATPYAVSKLAAEQLGKSYHLHYDLAVYRVRPGIHTGPGQPSRFALPSFARQIAIGERLGGTPALRVGNLKVMRDICDVRDMVRAYRCVLDHGTPGSCYNLGRGEGITLESVLNQLMEKSQTRMTVESQAHRIRTAESDRLVTNTARIRALGWAPDIALDQTLSDILKYWRDEVAKMDPSQLEQRH